jgi:hypothetical protein
MYTNNNCKILNQNYINNYKNAFQQYFIRMFYGSNIVMGSTLVKDDEDGE